MSSRITREIVEIAAAMQVKALAFDREHPNNSLGTRSAATYAAAIRALVPEQEGFEIVAAFDADLQRKRDKEASTPIYAMDRLAEIIQQRGVKMAILTVPAAAAQEVTNTLVACGITGILNFAPIVLHVPEEVMVNNVNLAIELENLSYFIQQ